jgi:hypothetical protein
MKDMKNMKGEIKKRCVSVLHIDYGEYLRGQSFSGHLSGGGR